MAHLAKEVADRLNRLGGFGTGHASGGGIAPETQIAAPAEENPTGGLKMEDRGIYHTAQAMGEFVVMGDAPSCSVCG